MARPPASLSRLTPVALAVGAHPDDIEFRMAGTLLLLKQAGFETHYLNVSRGSCGSVRHNATRTSATRRREARQAAEILGAHWHPSLADDLEILYALPLLRRLAAVIREVKPAILLTHPPVDYMEDHTATCRLAVTAAFARGMPNFRTSPARPALVGDVTIYHCLPHGLRDPLRRRVLPEAFVATAEVHATKREALAAHASQRHWLDVSQGMDSYLQAMENDSLEIGRLSRRFPHAEGWTRHLHLGFCAENADPLRDALGANHLLNSAWRRVAEKGVAG